MPQGMSILHYTGYTTCMEKPTWNSYNMRFVRYVMIIYNIMNIAAPLHSGIEQVLLKDVVIA